MNRTIVTCLLALLAAFFASDALAAIVNLHADFDGLQMVPPNASPAFGSLDATLDDTSGAFTVTTGTYQDLLGGATAAALNEGAASVNGPLYFLLTLDTPGAATGTFSGGGTLTAPQIVAMIAGNTNVRIRSTVFPAGEIRGQLLVVPEPTSLALLGFGAGGLFAIAWRRRRA